MPPSFGRFVVLELLGRGGMGEVFRAYDPVVAREVAIKRMLPGRYSDDARARLRREAQAMGKLVHPNVVALYTVEDGEKGQLGLVMEYVAGPSLQRWLHEKERSPEEILGHYRDAAAGLAAAHAEGLLHRDFKPANVLVAKSGAKVTDFGLVKLSHGPVTTWQQLSRSDEFLQTQEGIVLGTPRYMAPEQHANRELSGATDQYAFCVSLWEALVGKPPFTGPDLRALAKAKRAGPPRWPSNAGPHHVGRALCRGLSPNPSDRWPSMRALLRQLKPAHERWRPGAYLGAASVLSIGAAVTLRPAPPEGLCVRPAPSHWQKTRAAVVKRLDEVSDPGSGTRAARALDEYFDSWIATAHRICASTSLVEKRRLQASACIESAGSEATLVTDELSRADRELAEDAIDIIADLPPPSRCESPAALDASPPRIVDRTRRLAALQLRNEIQRASLAARKGDSAGCTERLADLQSELEAVDDDATRARHAFAKGRCLRKTNHAGALASLRMAFALALAADDGVQAVRSAALLASTLRRSDLEAARGWVSVALALLTRHDYRHPLAIVEVYSAAVAVDSDADENEAALARIREGLEVARRAGAAPAQLVALQVREAVVVANMAGGAEQLELVEPLVEDTEFLYGAYHPESLQALSLLGLSFSRIGRSNEAVDVFHEALDRAIEAGRERPKLSYAQFLLSAALIEAGKPAEGRRLALEALEDASAERLQTALMRNIAVAELRLRNPQGAESWVDRLEQRTGRDGLDRAALDLQRGEIATLRGQYDVAVSAYERAFEGASEVTHNTAALSHADILLDALLGLEALGQQRRNAWDRFEPGVETTELLAARLQTHEHLQPSLGPDLVGRRLRALERLALAVGEHDLAVDYATAARALRTAL